MPLVRATVGRSTNVAAEGDGTRDRRQPRIENRAEQSACSRTRKKPRAADAQSASFIEFLPPDEEERAEGSYTRELVEDQKHRADLRQRLDTFLRKLKP